LCHAEFGGAPEEDGAKSPDKPDVAQQASERNAFSAVGCQGRKAHRAEGTDKGNGQRNKKQARDAPAQTCVERKRAGHDRDNSANTIEGMQPVHGGSPAFRIDGCHHRAQHHVENAGAKAEAKRGGKQHAISG
jgi:hypothetical protein